MPHLMKMQGEITVNFLLFETLFKQFQKAESVKVTLFENAIVK